MTVQQWMAMQSEQYLNSLVRDIPFSLSYGLVKAYTLLPDAAKLAIQQAFEQSKQL